MQRDVAWGTNNKPRNIINETSQNVPYRQRFLSRNF
jgi:hypothetical protein